MVKIAVSSDNHFDINKVDLTPTIQAQAAFLTDQSVDDYLIAGDLFNDFTKSAAYVKQLSDQLPTTKVYFIAGNHDMIRGVSYDQLEHGKWPGYLNDQFVDIPETNYRIIGLNGTTTRLRQMRIKQNLNFIAGKWRTGLMALFRSL